MFRRFLREVSVFLLNEEFGAQTVAAKPRVGVVQILATILVEIPQRQRHGVDDDVCPDVGGHIDERAVALVLNTELAPACR